MKPFRYADYESQLMDMNYIQMLQRPRIRFFRGCKRVLDLACGPGIFLELLREAGIDALGVDRNEEIVRKAQQKGLNAVHSDIFNYLEKNGERVDGIFCSHLLEHLPFERVVHLVELIGSHLEQKGTLVFVFPNPGSIRLHLFGFWRDPEHVRFYTGNLIASVCQHYGLSVDYSSEEETPNLLEAPRLEPVSLPPTGKSRKGLFHAKKDERDLLLHEFNKQVEVFNQKIERFSEAFNKIWSRDDEVVIVCKK